jgi:uncharacterized membrane protein YqjE
MWVQSKIAQWQHLGRVCAQRASDYGELFQIELAEMKSRLLHEIVALMALAICTLFTLSFLCIAIIASAIGPP